ncbi:MAG TPA: transporter [Clostridiales bacterium]|nr:transporter [Clostridiales bacterium]
MLKDITLGQYFPGKSPLHTMDPRMKLLLTIFYIVILFFAKSVYAFAWMLLSTFVLILCSGLSFKLLIKGVKPIFFILLFTGVINLFFTKDTQDPLFSFWIFIVYPKGVYTAIFMIVRILCLVLGSSLLLTYTTTPRALTDAIERLLSPLNLLNIPVYDFAMMMSLALRFIPTLLEDTVKIMNAQKARGADFESGSLIKRAKALLPVLIPLLVTAFRRSNDLAVAMECRCYMGGKGRTRMKQLRLHASDLLAALLFLAFGAALFSCNYIPTGIRL